VITPVHPGLDGTPRPEWFDSVGDLATAYLDLLDEVDFREVLVVGTSFGGWIATEMALRDNHDRIGGLVLIGSVGIRANDPREIVDPINGTDFVQRVFHDPDDDSFADLPDEQRASAKKNVPALRVYGGKPYMHDPKLRRRLRRVTIPALLIWGECDEITPLEYGLAYARSFPRARFRPIADAGHVPQLKAPDSVAMTIYDFVTEELPHFARG
jgi:pimeloyl-ACP methyl ester carboxylesterase